MTKQTAPRQRRSKSSAMPGCTYSSTTAAMAAWGRHLVGDVAAGAAYGRSHGPDRRSAEVALWAFGADEQLPLVRHLVENATVLLIAKHSIPVVQPLIDAIADDVLHRCRRAIATRTVGDRGLETGIGAVAYRMLLHEVEAVLANVIRKGIESIEIGLGVRSKNYAPADRHTHSIEPHTQATEVRTQLTDQQKLDRVMAMLGRPGIGQSDRSDLVIAGFGITLKMMADEAVLHSPTVESRGDH